MKQNKSNKKDYAKKLAAALKDNKEKTVVNKTFATSQC